MVTAILPGWLPPSSGCSINSFCTASIPVTPSPTADVGDAEDMAPVLSESTHDWQSQITDVEQNESVVESAQLSDHQACEHIAVPEGSGVDNLCSPHMSEQQAVQGTALACSTKQVYGEKVQAAKAKFSLRQCSPAFGVYPAV
ncbi:hypothetical protein SRHO_G00333690 [Serrasalmus rhombeus]